LFFKNFRKLIKKGNILEKVSFVKSFSNAYKQVCKHWKNANKDRLE